MVFQLFVVVLYFICSCLQLFFRCLQLYMQLFTGFFAALCRCFAFVCG